MSDRRAWLALAVGDGRQHGGNDGYDDDPAVYYSWDDRVPNHSGPSEGDAIVLWNKRHLLGASIIDAIELGVAKKTLYTCPLCGRAGIKERKTLRPAFKCFKCGGVFDERSREDVEVATYRSRHDARWIDLAGLLSAAELRQLCERRNSQLSLRRLDWGRFTSAVEERLGVEMPRFVGSGERPLADGHRNTVVRVRVGQAEFRRAMLARWGSVCAFTGPAPPHALEACHLYKYAVVGKHHETGGLMLRRDVHRLFDLGLLAIDPETRLIDVAQSLRVYPAYAALHGRRPTAALSPAQWTWLRDHWRQHRRSAS